MWATPAGRFTVERGEVFAVLGPNGAGKTTTVEILEGHRGRDEGQVSVWPLDARRGCGSRRQEGQAVCRPSRCGVTPRPGAARKGPWTLVPVPSILQAVTVIFSTTGGSVA
ncbi:ATP-binding cassette domain-containing protein [Nonomuraea aurantiaca]|uniref:ATP-binding cassette domain-containing protein n=1 Tax=Nonomuraea aurantiaca TaxID=2878562 RepID=UPI00355894E1